VPHAAQVSPRDFALSKPFVISGTKARRRFHVRFISRRSIVRLRVRRYVRRYAAVSIARNALFAR
jgi:hypothetical protein